MYGRTLVDFHTNAAREYDCGFHTENQSSLLDHIWEVYEKWEKLYASARRNEVFWVRQML